MEDYCIPKKISGGGSFRGKRPVGWPCSWLEDNIQKDATSLLHLWRCKTAVQNRQNERKKTGEAMIQKEAEAP
jgi:hypothetical protein